MNFAGRKDKTEKSELFWESNQMKYYLRFPREDGLYYTSQVFQRRDKALRYLYRFYESKDGWWNMVRPDKLGSWGVHVPTRAYKDTYCSYHVDSFPTHAEAIAFAKERFDTDDQGRINLIDAA